MSSNETVGLHDEIDCPVMTETKTDPMAKARVKVNIGKEQTLRLHELMTQVGAFQVLVFTGDLWKLLPKTAPQKLVRIMDRHLADWRSRWTPSSNKENDESKKDSARPLVMIHTFTTVSSFKATKNTISLVDKKPGDGKAYLDPKGLLHRRYEVNTKVKNGPGSGGAIVVVRPDSYIAYRVQGVDANAWNNVQEYFESILVCSK